MASSSGTASTSSTSSTPLSSSSKFPELVEAIGIPLEELTLAQLKELCSILDLPRAGIKANVFTRIFSAIEEIANNEAKYKLFTQEAKKKLWKPTEEEIEDEVVETTPQSGASKNPRDPSGFQSPGGPSQNQVDLSVFEPLAKGTSMRLELYNYLFSSTEEGKSFSFFSDSLQVKERKEILAGYSKYSQLPTDVPALPQYISKKLFKGAKAREEELLNLQRRTLDILTPLTNLTVFLD
jgi:hypothetical protein